MRHPIYVIGHKNPDTDSIVSAIAYADYKRQLGQDCVSARLGSVSKETEYLLDKYGFEDPIRLYSAKKSLKEIEMDDAVTTKKDITMKRALEKVVKLKNKGLVVVDKDDKLEGIVTLDDLTYIWAKTDKQLEKIIKTIELKNVLRTLKAKTIIKSKNKLSGALHLFPSLKSKVNENSIVLIRNEEDKLIYCLDRGAKLLIVITSSKISNEVIELAKQNKATIVVTELSPLSVSRMIYQVPTIEQIMTHKDKIIYFNINDTVEDVSKKITKSRKRSYPVIDDENKVIGSLSRYHLFNYEKKKLILVDHNETKQSIEDIEHADVLEIIDHHRFGGLKTDNPININTEVLGATATIIAKMYLENKSVKLSKNMAGILLGAIVSDTMNFNSPTTTQIDVEIAKKLEKLAKISHDELSKEMIANSESLLSKRFIEIVYNDFKEYNIDGNKVGLAQAVCKSKQEYLTLKKDLRQYISDQCKSQNYCLLVVMLTNPQGLGSYLIYEGSKCSVIDSLFKDKIKEGFIEGLVSRKKQLLPNIIKEFE